MKEDLRKEIELPDKVGVKIDRVIRITGPQGEVEKRLAHPRVRIFLEGNKLGVEAKKATKNEKKVLNSFYVHLKNMVKGVREKYVYKLKICSGHFPMNVSVAGSQFIIKNFFGESVPRKLTILPGAEVKIEGNEIVVKSVDKEIAGQVAGSIEQLCRIRGRDLRIFQDGCYITNKAGKEI